MKDENSERRAGWALGLALIVFLILVLGSIIGLSITRDGIFNFIGRSDPLTGDNTVKNYITYEDGRKENNSSAIVNAEFEIDGLIFSNFVLETKDDESTTLSMNIKNATENDIAQKTIVFGFLDNFGDEIIDELAMLTPEVLPANSDTQWAMVVLDNIVNADEITVRELGKEIQENNEVVSGENTDINNEVSGD